MSELRTIVTSVSKYLRERGFLKDKRTWNRPKGKFVQVLDIQVSEKTITAVTLNAGVLHTEVSEICWGKLTPRFVREPDCTVRWRTKSPDGKEKWWILSHEGAESRLLEVRAALEGALMTFLEKNISEQKMMEQPYFDVENAHGYPLPAIYLWVLCTLSGRIAEGDQAMRVALNAANEQWRQRIVGIRGRLAEAGG